MAHTDTPSRPSRDPELTAVMERADSLRVPRRELCLKCGETDVTVWRWQFANDAQWRRRAKFMERATVYLDEVQQRYADL